MRSIRQLIILPFLILAFTSSAQREDQRIVSSHYEFEEGSTEYLYGDNVVFRSEPSSTSKALDTLSIGSKIEIVRATDITGFINGLDWNWYKVKVGRKTGYILAGLIALDRIRFDDAIYLVTMAGVDNSMDGYDYIDYKVRARVLLPTGEFYGHESKLNTNMFYVDAFGNRGLEGIENMLVINMYAEACGVDGGAIYLFNNGNRLIEGLSLSNVSEAGVFWYSEKVIFPGDEDAWGDAVQYEREYGEYMNDDMNWTKATVHTLRLTWENEQFSPNLKEFEFGEDE